MITDVMMSSVVNEKVSEGVSEMSTRIIFTTEMPMADNLMMRMKM